MPRHTTVADGNWNAVASDAERAAYTVRCSYRPGPATSVALSFVGDADAAAIRAVVVTRRRDGEVLGGFVPAGWLVWYANRDFAKARQDSGVRARNKASGLVPLVVPRNPWAT